MYLGWLLLSAAPLHAPPSIAKPLFTLSLDFTTVQWWRGTEVIDLSERNVKGGRERLERNGRVSAVG